MRFTVTTTQPPTPSTPLYPGDPISGAVNFFSPQAEDILSVKLSFAGRAKSKIMTTRSNGSGTYTEIRRNRDVFFTYDVTLYTGHYTLRQNVEYTWPFNFVLPTEVKITPPQPGRLSSRGPIPATVESPPCSFESNCKFKGRQKGSYGAVQYTLTAEVVRRGTIKDHTTEAECQLTVRSFRPEIVDAGYTTQSWGFSAVDVRLFPGMEDYHPSIKERMKEAFSSNPKPKPCLAVDLRCYLPSNLVIGEGMAGKVWIEWSAERSRLLESGRPVNLVSVSANLWMQTTITAGSTLQTAHNKTEKLLAYVYTSAEGTEMQYGEENAVDLSAQMSEYWSKMVGSGVIVPSFDTTTVSRRYWIEVKVVLNCLGKKWKKEFSRNVTVLPGDERRGPLELPPPPPPVEEGVGSGSGVGGSEKGRIDAGAAEELPSYEDVGEGGSSSAAAAAAAARRVGGEKGEFTV